jgi:hypothetical protein
MVYMHINAGQVNSMRNFLYINLQSDIACLRAEPLFVDLLRVRNRFSAWRAGTTTLFLVPARQAT